LENEQEKLQGDFTENLHERQTQTVAERRSRAKPALSVLSLPKEAKPKGRGNTEHESQNADGYITRRNGANKMAVKLKLCGSNITKLAIRLCGEFSAHKYIQGLHN